MRYFAEDRILFVESAHKITYKVIFMLADLAFGFWPRPVKTCLRSDSALVVLSGVVFWSEPVDPEALAAPCGLFLRFCGGSCWAGRAA